VKPLPTWAVIDNPIVPVSARAIGKLRWFQQSHPNASHGYVVSIEISAHGAAFQALLAETFGDDSHAVLPTLEAMNQGVIGVNIRTKDNVACGGMNLWIYQRGIDWDDEDWMSMREWEALHPAVTSWERVLATADED
jgi:hypothetical protein